MEAVEKTLTYQDDTGLYRKLLPDDKDMKAKCHAETRRDESNYVDLDNLLDMKSDGTKTVKVTFTGEGDELAVIKCDNGTSNERSPNGLKGFGGEDELISGDFQGEHSKEKWTDRPVAGEHPLDTLLSTRVPNEVEYENQFQNEFEPAPSDCNENVHSESDELQYTEMNSKSESDDGESVVLSEHCGSDTIEDESHYITTHEIQLTELDHDVDYEVGRGSCWDYEDENLVYSFVDYASFESDESQNGTLTRDGRGQAKSNKAQSNVAHHHQRADRGAAVRAEPDSELCDSDKCASSDESRSVCKNQSGAAINPAGKIHLSIQTSSRAVNEPNSVLENDNTFKHVGDGRGHFFFTSSNARAEALCDRPQYFIPAPGRQHLATKLRGKDINDYSSGASSSISELDDADKEVRNLTAKSFRSLACPYFDAINLSASSESSVSEYGIGLNKWSAYVDLKYGNMSQGRDQNTIARESSSATFEMSQTTDRTNIHGKSISNTQTKLYELNKKTACSQQASSSTKKIELKGPFQPQQGDVITLTETVNIRCNVEAEIPEGAKRPKCSKKAHGSRSKHEISGNVSAKLGCEMHYQHHDAGGTAGGTHNKAVFASSLLKNVISKKMQFEQERKMERGEVRDKHHSHSPCCQCNEHEAMKERYLGKGFHRQTSETGSGFSSLDEQGTVSSRANSCEPTEEHTREDALETSPLSAKGHDDKNYASEPPPKGQLHPSQNSAFQSLKEAKPESEIPRDACEPPSTSGATAKEEMDASRSLTKLSQLYVPSSHLLSKEKDGADDLLSSTPVVHTPARAQDSENDLNGVKAAQKEEETKPPEIKIRLRSVKENKGYTLNIASLLTPKISYDTVNTMRTVGEPKCHVLAASDKIPHFTVRDIRDNKCKFQTPIYHVRDVRKLVKSSYRFVSMDNSESKCSTIPSTAADTHEDRAKKETIKHLLPSPIVIKCHSVKTNCNIKQPTATTDALSQKQMEVGRSSPRILPETSKSETASSQCTTSRVAPVLAKHIHPDQSELSRQRQERVMGDTGDRRSESKIPKQAALEKLKAAVKTMEQLYVFDRNEWKRKSQAPQPVTSSHVLSLITSEEQGADEVMTAAASNRLTEAETSTVKVSQSLINACMSEMRKCPEKKGSLKIIHVPYNEDAFTTQSQHSKTFSNKSVLHFGSSGRAPVSVRSPGNDILQSSIQTLSTKKSVGSKAPMAPLSVKIAPPKRGQGDQGKVKCNVTNANVTLSNSDSENYLTIPGGGETSEIEVLNQDELQPNIISKEGSSNVSQANGQASIGDAKRPECSDQSLKRSPFVMEEPSATIYHQPVPVTLQGPQPQVFCFSPSVTVSPSPASVEAIPQTQRKVLLDPTTGHYYLVETPLQATTKRLFDPETGQYVDVPMPHSPVAPVTPVPLSVSPLALSPGTYAPTYMIYPGMIPSPTLPAQPQPPKTVYLSAAEDARGKHSGQAQCTTVTESPYYSATGGAAKVPPRLPVTMAHVNTRGRAASSEIKPVISITSQQGPRIIAPPSFDGTTMSFVVEHR